MDSSREVSRGGKGQRGRGRRGQSETETGGSRSGKEVEWMHWIELRLRRRRRWKKGAAATSSFLEPEAE